MCNDGDPSWRAIKKCVFEFSCVGSPNLVSTVLIPCLFPFFSLFTNSYSLNNVGPITEQVFGPGRFLATYLVSGATGNLLSAINSPNPALGASGAVFGVMGGLYVFLSRNDWVMGQQGEAYSSAITQTLLINLFMGAVNPMV